MIVVYDEKSSLAKTIATATQKHPRQILTRKIKSTCLSASTFSSPSDRKVPTVAIRQNQE
ncbi:MAG: hypothetical protein IJ192_06730 [Clostridia bacterium]|nr:hypothetical protein [Clostridia bacterium]